MANDDEINVNAAKFREVISTTLSSNIVSIVARDAVKLDDAYARLTTLQSWRSFVLDGNVSNDALGFFAEAQNDGLTSSVLVSSGLWRSSMKSLRSLIENLIQSLYFMDHPVEYRKWEAGNYRPAFSELFNYFSDHPDIRELSAPVNPVVSLKKHYSHLSNVVHSSAREFRMTGTIDKFSLWRIARADVGKWSTTQKNVLRDANLLLLVMFKDKLLGASNSGLRESLSLALPSSKDARIKSDLGVKIIRK